MSSHSVFRSCHSDPVPRSRVVLHRSGIKEYFGTTPERCPNEEGGWAKVGWFPQKGLIGDCIAKMSELQVVGEDIEAVQYLLVLKAFPTFPPDLKYFHLL